MQNGSHESFTEDDFVVCDNPLVEYHKEDSWLEPTYNPFYVLQSKESEDEEFWIKNSIYSGTNNSNYIMSTFVHEELSDLITNMHSTLTRTGDNCVVGYQLIDYIQNASNGHFVRPDAKVFVNRYILVHLVPTPYHISLTESVEENIRYRFARDDHQKYYPAPPLLNVLQNNEKQRYDQAMKLQVTDEDLLSVRDMIDSFYDPRSQLFSHFPDSLQREIVSNLEGVMEKVCSDVFVNQLLGTYDYRKLTEDKTLYRELVYCCGQLRYLNLELIRKTIDLRALLVNIHNIMSIHSAIVRGCKETKKDREIWYKSDLFYLGNFKLSLHDVSILALGEPNRLAPHKQFLTKFACNRDIRVYFVLCSGARGDPSPYALHTLNYEIELAYAASNFVNRMLQIDFNHKTVFLHEMFCRNLHQFCDRRSELLRTMLPYLTDLYKRSQLMRLIKTGAEIRFHKYDYTSNRRPMKGAYRLSSFTKKREENSPIPHELSFHVVKENEFFREYFKKFCEYEYSVENLLFWLMCSKYKELLNEGERRTLANHIYETFLDPSSELEVNLTRRAVEEVARTLSIEKPTERTRFISHSPNRNNSEEFTLKFLDQMMSSPRELVYDVPESGEPLSPYVFDKLVWEIEKVLQDTYARFVLSETYKEMVEEAHSKGMVEFLDDKYRVVSRYNVRRGSAPSLFTSQSESDEQDEVLSPIRTTAGRSSIGTHYRSLSIVPSNTSPSKNEITEEQKKFKNMNLVTKLARIGQGNGSSPETSTIGSPGRRESLDSPPGTPHERDQTPPQEPEPEPEPELQPVASVNLSTPTTDQYQEIIEESVEMLTVDATETIIDETVDDRSADDASILDIDDIIPVHDWSNLKVERTCIVIRDFEATQSEEIDVKIGQQVVVCWKSGDRYWVNCEGREGFVPASFLLEE